MNHLMTSEQKQMMKRVLENGKMDVQCCRFARFYK